MAAQPEQNSKPLAAYMRPQTWDALHGIPELEDPESPLHSMKRTGKLASCILYGPPGCGKTTIARILARMQKEKKGAVHHGHGGQITKKDLDNILKENKENAREGELGLNAGKPPPLLFLDEIHRLTRVQSEFLLQSTEEGELVLIGATTENPYISLGPALLSRCPVIQLKGYTKEALSIILQKTFEKAQKQNLPGTLTSFSQETLVEISRLAGGDARTAINLLEQALTIRGVAPDERIPEILRNRIAPMSTKMDDFGDLHYDITSAFIKSMRGSAPNATMHWLCRLMDGGVDPRYIARRIAIHASEDVGMADPTALLVATAALQAVEKIGYPECRLTLSQAALHVALAPKSPAVCDALSKAEADLKAGYQPAIPPYLRDNHYKGAVKLGVGGYDHPGHYPHGKHPSGTEHDYCPEAPQIYWNPNENDPRS
jgi:putative ATPase